MIQIARHLPTATEALAAMRSGKLRAAALFDQCVARMTLIEAQAWVEIDADRLHEAGSSIGARYAEYPLGLSGVPIGVKDIIDVANWPTRGGSYLTSAMPADRDAPIVARLREAGAALLGKTVTCQFACFDPAPTKNPWNFGRTPGGSSAGSAAAVALGQCLIALGTQTGGSILRPASYCGVCGFKPAHDPQWLEGVLPVSSKLDHVGPLARCVTDLELAWRAITGAAPAAQEARTPRLGVLRDYFWEHASDDVRELTSQTLGRLQSAGAELCEVPLPSGFGDVHACHRTIMAFDVARQHIAAFENNPDAFGRQLAKLIYQGMEISPTHYARAVEFQRSFRENLLTTYTNIDALVMPATSTTAPSPETTGDASFHVPWSFAGVPAVCFPIGLASSDDMPCGLQLVRPQGTSCEDEFALLTLARWCEATLAVDLWPELNKRLGKRFHKIHWVDQI